MRAAASLLLIAASACTLALVGTPALAQPAGGGATVTPYQDCFDDPPVSSCSTGRAIVRLTAAPSGASSGTLIDNGRFEVQNQETGCTTTGSYQFSNVFATGPDPAEHVVQRNSQRISAKTRCGDRTLDTQCLTHSTVFIQVLPDEARMTVRLRVNCDRPA